MTDEPEALPVPDRLPLVAPEAAPPVGVEPVAPPVPALVGVRQLIGTSLDLLLRMGEPMRRASFYIGAIVLGTTGPTALALWGMYVTQGGLDGLFLASGQAEAAAAWLSLLVVVLFGGIVVASIESQAIVIALLGSHLVGAPITVREAVQRSRMVFWAVIGATLVASIPASIVQNVVIGQGTQLTVMLGLVVGILIQVPFVYAVAGIVLGGVGPIEALKRSVRLVRARKLAAVLIALLPAAFGLLVLVAFESGADLAIRSTEALGLGIDSGPFGLAVLTVLIVGLVFAVGTLLLTAAGIIYAPQVVMFVGLTRATMGLDPVRPGGDHAVEPPAPARPPFRWLTRPMLVAMALGALGLAGFLSTLAE